MVKEARLEWKEGTCYLHGDISISNVMQLHESAEAIIKDMPEFIFDFSAMQNSDSAGLAFIVEWAKYAKQHQKKMKIVALPDDLYVLAKAAGIDGFLKLVKEDFSGSLHPV